MPSTSLSKMCSDVYNSNQNAPLAPTIVGVILIREFSFTSVIVPYYLSFKNKSKFESFRLWPDLPTYATSRSHKASGNEI